MRFQILAMVLEEISQLALEVNGRLHLGRDDDVDDAIRRRSRAQIVIAFDGLHDRIGDGDDHQSDRDEEQAQGRKHHKSLILASESAAMPANRCWRNGVSAGRSCSRHDSSLNRNCPGQYGPWRSTSASGNTTPHIGVTLQIVKTGIWGKMAGRDREGPKCLFGGKQGDGESTRDSTTSDGEEGCGALLLLF
jgi:hypothetical protein